MLKEGMINKQCLLISLVMPTMLFFLLIIGLFINVSLLNYNEKQDVYLLYSRLIDIEKSNSFSEDLIEIVKHNDNIYSIDHKNIEKKKHFPNEYFYNVEHTVRGLELILNITTSKRHYMLRSSNKYLEEWMSSSFLFTSNLATKPTDVRILGEKLSELKVSKYKSGYKLSRKPSITISKSDIGITLLAYIITSLSIYLCTKTLYKYELINLDESKLARLYLSKTLISKAVIIKFQPIVNSSNSKIIALECLCRVNNKADSAPDWITELNDDICFDLFKASYFAIKRNDENGLTDIVRTYTINMSAASVVKYQSQDAWLELSQQGGVKVIIELSAVNTQNIDEIRNATRRLKKLGYKFMLDNFLDDETSIQLLFTLPIDYIKIDRSFIKNIVFKKNYELLLGLSKFCKNNSIRIIASGVTTSIEKGLLEKQGIFFHQGFYYSKAKNISELISVENHDFKKIPNSDDKCTNHG